MTLEQIRKNGAAVPLPDRARREDWTQWLGSLLSLPVELSIPGSLESSFRASAATLHCGEMMLLDLRLSSCDASWLFRENEQDSLYRISVLHHSGRALASWHGTDVELSDGAVFLMGGRDGSWRAPTGLRIMQLQVPRSLVDNRGPHLVREELSGGDADLTPSPLANVVRAALLGSLGRLDQLAEVPLWDLGEIWRHLAQLVLCQPRQGGSVRIGSEHLSRDEIVRRYVTAHISDPDLSPARVADALHISRRALYNALVEDEPGVATMIRNQRLALARQRLADPAYRHTSIAEIALGVGIRNASRFSRLFHEQFGASPRAYRQGNMQMRMDPDSPAA